MGFFSWKTCDTQRSIPNSYNGVRNTFPVNLIDHQNNRWLEKNYDGFGVFGGMDFYELLAKMNGKKTREEGLNLAFSGKKAILWPKLVEDPSKRWQDLPNPEICEYQGHFYPDSEQFEAANAVREAAGVPKLKKPRKTKAGG